MSYFLTSKMLKLIYDDDNDIILKTFVLGTVIYIILHCFIFSKLSSDFITNYGKYLYYIWFIDFAVTMILIKMPQLLGTSKDEINSESEQSEYESDSDSEEDEQQLNKGRTMTKEEIMNKLKEIKEPDQKEVDEHKNKSEKVEYNTQPEKKENNDGYENNLSNTAVNNDDDNKDKDSVDNKNSNNKDDIEQVDDNASSETELDLYISKSG